MRHLRAALSPRSFVFSSRSVPNGEGGDDAPGASGNFADVHASHASVLTDDIVIEQVVSRYITSGTDSRGLPDLATSWVRTHDAPTTVKGALSAFSGGDAKYAIATFAATYYDDADRVIRSAEFGTNQTGFKHGGTAPTVNQASPPTWNTGDQLVTAITYNNRGLVDSVTDPQNVVSKVVYDALARTVASINAFVNGTVEWDNTLGRWEGANLNDDVDRLTSTIYDLENKVIKQLAHLPNGAADEVQVTEYHFGVTKGAGASDSLLHSNDLLRKIVFPDHESGETEPDYAVYFSYNRLGEPRFKEDQNRTEHFFTRDKAGRIIVDKAVADAGSDIDDTINALVYAFDDFGRLEFARSYTDYGGGSQAIANSVKFVYTALWQVDKFWQDPDGDIVLSGGDKSPNVVPTYETVAVGSGNYSRVTDVQYPDGNKIGYAYGSSGTVNHIISRVNQIKRGALSNSPVLATYEYLGLSGIARVGYDQVDVSLNYKLKHNGVNTDGEYGGFDRFGRVTRHAWTDDTFGAHGSSGSVPNIPPIVEMAYAFDRVSNVLSAYDNRPGARQERSHEYEYDSLHRLKEAERGLWDASTPSFTEKKDSQRYTQDILNNFRRIETDADGAGGYESDETEDRDNYSDANELLGRDTDNDSTDEIEFEYDLNGNTTCVDNTPGGGGSARIVRYTYDPWNRLIKVDHQEGANTYPAAEYSYNALHHRTVKRLDTNPDDSTHALNQQRVMVYLPTWQLAEELVDDSWISSTPSIDRHVQCVWGGLYIDDIILHREDGNADGDYNDGNDSTWHHLTDPQFSTVAILDSSGVVKERVSYDAWGEARHHPHHDFDADGDFDQKDSDDLAAVIAGGAVNITQAAYRAEMDIDRDGDIDSTDQTLCGTSYIAALPKGQLSTPGPGSSGGIDNLVGWCGYLYDQPIKVYCVRFRYYDPTTFRWLNRDPAGYVDSMNLYGYGWGNSIWAVDPTGTDLWGIIPIEETISIIGTGVGAAWDWITGSSPSALTTRASVGAGVRSFVRSAIRSAAIAAGVGLVVASLPETAAAVLTTGVFIVGAASIILYIIERYQAWERMTWEERAATAGEFLGFLAGGWLGFNAGAARPPRARPDTAVPVTHWGPTPLGPTGWVMLGHGGWFNFWFWFNWVFSGAKYRPSNFKQTYLPGHTLQLPREFGKSLLPQRQYYPDAPCTHPGHPTVLPPIDPWPRNR